MKRFGWVLALLILVSTGYPGAVSSQEEEAESVFGVVGGYWRPEAADELGVSWEIIPFDWAKIQPNGPGDFDLSSARSVWFTTATDQGREVVGQIINTPAWASESGTPAAVPDGIYAPVDNPENQWAIFLRQLVEQFAPQGVSRWIIWNTPDIQPGDPLPHTFEGTVADYYRMVKVAHQVIREVDPTAEIYTGGLVWWMDILAERELFLQQFLEFALEDPFALENGYFFTGVSLDVRLRPEALSGVTVTTDSAGDIAFTVRQILDTAGFEDKTIWVTALGLSPTLDETGGLPGTSLNFTLMHQAEFVVQGVVLALAAGASRVAVYRLFDPNFESGVTIPYGLVRFDNTLRPAYQAYQLLIGLLNEDIQMIEAGRSQNSRLVVFEQTDRTIYLMWTAGETPVDFWVERNFGDEPLLYDVLGNALPEPRVGVGRQEIDVHVIETLSGQPSADGLVRVSGSPVILILSGEARAVWAAREGNAVRLR